MAAMRASLFLLPALFLGACSTLPTKSPSVPTDPQRETHGSVPGWTGGAGSVSLMVDDQTLSSAPITAAGKFILPLPTASALSGLGVSASSYPAFADGCQRDVRASVPDARLVVVSSLTVQPSGGKAQLLSRFENTYDQPLDASNSVQHLLVYASSATQLYGEVNCAAAQKRASYSVLLRLNQGWNEVTLTQSILAGGEIRAVTQFVSAPLQVDTVWKLGSLQALSR